MGRSRSARFRLRFSLEASSRLNKRGLAISAWPPCWPLPFGTRDSVRAARRLPRRCQNPLG